MDIRGVISGMNDIFKYGDAHSEDDRIRYSKCELLIDFGPFKRGQRCDACIQLPASGNLTMTVECDGRSETSILTWVHVK